MLIGRRHVRRGRLAKIVDEKQRAVRRLLAAPPPRREFEPRRSIVADSLARGAASIVCTDTSGRSEHGSAGFRGLAEARRSTAEAVVALDYFIHPIQLEWAAAAGADAVVLIARLAAGETESFDELVREAERLGMVPIIEIASAEEAVRARSLGVEVAAISEIDRDHIDEVSPRFSVRSSEMDVALAQFDVRVALESGRPASPWVGAPLHAHYPACGVPAPPPTMGLSASAAP